ncbi:MAG: DUF3710 domain-containing protein [Actinobacteria bacterium]|nr:DUF3710 domain-containing protein [Actinomycetota bacterium]
MALFSRRREPEPVDEVEEPPAAGTGPFDVEDVPDLGGRIDLGALRIPPRPGMQVRVELDRATRKPVSLTLTDGASALQLQVYAAPRSASLWDEIRPELAQSIEDRSGTSDDVPGVFGRELLARMPVTTQGGSGMRAVRFVGIDGPRWMIRGAFSGKAAVDPEAARTLEEVLRDIVVVRGPHARPPREVLALTLPGSTPAAEPAPSDDPLGILRRGPEITEIR